MPVLIPTLIPQLHFINTAALVVIYMSREPGSHALSAVVIGDVRVAPQLQVLQHVGVSGRSDPVLRGDVRHQLVGGSPDQRHRSGTVHLRQLQEAR